MDATKRNITKLARVSRLFAAKVLKGDGLGPAEYDYIHLVRKNPGISQEKLSRILGIDKAAAARRAQNLERKGYITKSPDETDGRKKRLFPTDKAETLKNSTAWVEAFYYEWLARGIPKEKMDVAVEVLELMHQRANREKDEEFESMMADEKAAREGLGL